MTQDSTPCAVCGTEPVAGASYCHRCGAPIGGEAAASWLGGEEAATEGSSGSEKAGAPIPGWDASSGAGLGAGASSGGSGGLGIGSVANAGGSTGLGIGDQAGADSRMGLNMDAGASSGSSAGLGTGAGGGASDEGLERAARGDYQVRIGDWMSRGWNVFTQGGGLFIGFTAIIWIFSLLVLSLVPVAIPLVVLLFPPISTGLLISALIVRRGGRLQFSDFWLGFNDFLPLFLAWLIYCALLFAGLLTCGVATLYLWVAYQFVYLLVVDRGLDFWDALEASRSAVTRHWFGLFAFAALLLLLNLVAFFMTFSLGILVTLPLTSCALVEAYADIFGVRGRLPGREASAARAVPARP